MGNVVAAGARGLDVPGWFNDNAIDDVNHMHMAANPTAKNTKEKRFPHLIPQSPQSVNLLSES